jgi:sporulation protein YlmC with PRC-barrel domain
MRRILMPIVVALAAGYSAHAQDVAPKPDPNARPAATSQPLLAQPLVGLPIYSSDAQKVGQVTSIDVAADGRINAVQAEIEGFLGLGSSSVRITSDQFEQKGDRIVLPKTADQVRGVPDKSYKSFDPSRSGAPGAP